MRRGRTLVGLGLAVVAAGAFAAPAGASGGGGPVAQSILGSGSDTTQVMMASLDSLYQFSPGCQQIPNPGGTAWYDFSCLAPDPAGVIKSENYEHDQVAQAYFLGSSNGIHQLCNQGVAGNSHVDYARSSRAPKIPGDCSGLHFVAYARDGIPIEVFRTFTNRDTVNGGPCLNKANCISQAEAKAIWGTCSITDWHQIDTSIPSGTTIDMYTPQAGSGTRGTFDNFIGGSGSETCIDARGTSYMGTHVIPENQNVSIQTNRDASVAMFPFSYGVWTTQVKPHNPLKASLAAIDGVIPTPTTIANLSFPYGRYLFNVFCAAASGAAGTCAANGITASQATVNYVGEEGWICKPGTGTWAADGGPHTTNPVTGKNFQADIAKTITSFGFVPIPSGAIGGGDTNSDYCRLFTT